MSASPRPGRPEPESQVDAEAGVVSGPLLADCHRAPGATVAVRWVAGPRVHDAHLAGALCDCAAPPRVTWTLGERSGPLSAMSFVGLWNAEVAEVAGHPVRCDLEDVATLETPFVAWHPSGTWQLVRFDRGAGVFVRRVLYPATRPEVSDVVSTHVVAG